MGSPDLRICRGYKGWPWTASTWHGRRAGWPIVAVGVTNAWRRDSVSVAQGATPAGARRTLRRRFFAMEALPRWRRSWAGASLRRRRRPGTTRQTAQPGGIPSNSRIWSATTAPFHCGLRSSQRFHPACRDKTEMHPGPRHPCFGPCRTAPRCLGSRWFAQQSECRSGGLRPSWVRDSS